MYGHTNRTHVEIVNIRCVSYEKVEPLDAYRIQRIDITQEETPVFRDAWFLGLKSPIQTKIYSRASMLPNQAIAGPAIVEQSDTTILVYPGQVAKIDTMNNLKITGISEAYTT